MCSDIDPTMSSSASLRINAPGSKSQTQRALILAALADGTSSIVAPLECDDSRHLRGALEQLGVQLTCEPGRWQVRGGVGRLQAPCAPLDCGEGGTTLRFLAPLSLLLDGPVVLEGQGRLRQRPVAEMIEALEALGVRASNPEASGASLPLCLERRRASATDRIKVNTSRSSQFLSGLLLVAPCLQAGLQLEAARDAGPAMVSRPYVEMTLAAMAAFGAKVIEQPQGTFEVQPAAYRPCPVYPVEGDWSAGAFLLVAARITGRQLEVPNLTPLSVQGDRAMAGFLEELDRQRPHRFDLTHCPDLVAPLAAACATTAGSHPCHITGAAHTRHKESDRLTVLARGLARAGVSVAERHDGLEIHPARKLVSVTLDPAGDHRMAMAFGLLGLREPGIRVEDRGCVSKSYPGFWDDLRRFSP